MARFVSKYENYKITARITVTHEDVLRAPHLTPQRGLNADFYPALVTDWEREEANKHFVGANRFNGLQMEEDEVTPIQPRLGGFDSEIAAQTYGWSKEEREYVERFLDGNSANGMDYIRVEKAKLAPPWESYPKLTAQGRRTKEMVAAKIVEIAGEIGCPAERIIAFERENLNRPEVLTRVEEYGSAVPVDDTITVAA